MICRWPPGQEHSSLSSIIHPAERNPIPGTSPRSSFTIVSKVRVRTASRPTQLKCLEGQLPLGGALHCCRPPGSTGKKVEGIQVSLQGKHLLPQPPVPCMWLCLWTCENLKQPWSTEHSFADSSCIPEAKGNVKRAFAPYARCLSFLPREMSAVSPSTFL